MIFDWLMIWPSWAAACIIIIADYSGPLRDRMTDLALRIQNWAEERVPY